MPSVAPANVPLKPVNKKANRDFALAQKSYYGTPTIPFLEVAQYSLNSAMVFYIVANVFSVWYLIDISNDNQNEKLFTFGVMLFLTQVMYNYLDLNSSNNIAKLEAFT